MEDTDENAWWFIFCIITKSGENKFSLRIRNTRLN